MSTPDIQREQAIADEYEEWAQEQLRRLWEVHANAVPWHDSGPEGIGQQGEPGADEGLIPPLTVLAAGTCDHDSDTGDAAASPLSQSARPVRG
jgi:hypothetical protein